MNFFGHVDVGEPVMKASNGNSWLEAHVERPRMTANGKKLVMEAGGGKIMVGANGRKPRMETSGRKPGVAVSGRKVRVDVNGRKPGMEVMGRKRGMEAHDEKPDIKASWRKSKTEAKGRKPLCTHKIFREYYAQNHKFPEEGHVLGKKPPLIRWEECRFQFTMSQILQCLTKQSIRKILLLGDSQGRGYFNVLVKLLGLNRFHCTEKKSERAVYVDGGTNQTYPDLTYFNDKKRRQSVKLTVSARNTSSCLSSLYMCTDTANVYSITTEFICMPNIRSTELTVKGSPGSYQEFIFKQYLQNNFPDLIFFFIPLNHEKKHDVQSVATRMKHLVNLLHTYKNPSTKVYWISGTSEFEEKRTSDKWRNMLFGGLLATDAIYLRNQEVFKLLEPDLMEPSSSFFGFFNLVNVSKPWTKWNKDGVHFLPGWYKIIVTSILALFCQS